MAGTLWVADALFAFAANGARAFHLHWGHGGLPFQGGSPNVGVQTNFDYNVRSTDAVCLSWPGYACFCLMNLLNSTQTQMSFLLPLSLGFV